MGLRIERNDALAAAGEELGFNRGVILARRWSDVLELDQPGADAQGLARLGDSEPLAAKGGVARHADEGNGDAEVRNHHPPGRERSPKRIAADQREDTRADEIGGDGEAEPRK